MRAVLICLALLLSACAQANGADKSAPAIELTGRVVDAADILSEQFEDELTARLAQLETETKVQLVVATTPDLKGYDIADYSFELANLWGIGSKERDDGLLVLVAPNERKVRIAVGLGLEASVKDEEAAEIIREAIIPAFRKSDYETGVSQGVDRLIDEVTPIELKEAA